VTGRDAVASAHVAGMPPALSGVAPGRLGLRPNFNLHFANLVDASPEVISIGQLGHAGRGAGCNHLKQENGRKACWWLL
jgi:hypothetical protein